MKALLVFLILEFIIIWSLFVGADNAAKEFQHRWQEHYAIERIEQ